MGDDVRVVQAAVHAAVLGREIMGVGTIDRHAVVEAVAGANSNHITIRIGNADGAETILDRRLVPTDAAAQGEAVIGMIETANGDHPAVLVIEGVYEGYVG